MRVTFTCEKCGYDYGESVVVQDGLDLLIPHGTRLPYKRTCPNCAKLTYGPLTEEMMSEALCEAWFPGLDWDSQASKSVREHYGAQARFVLRLLNKANERDGCPLEGWPTGDRTRTWLIDLARQR